MLSWLNVEEKWNKRATIYNLHIAQQLTIKTNKVVWLRHLAAGFNQQCWWLTSLMCLRRRRFHNPLEIAQCDWHLNWRCVFVWFQLFAQPFYRVAQGKFAKWQLPCSYWFTCRIAWLSRRSSRTTVARASGCAPRSQRRTQIDRVSASRPVFNNFDNSNRVAQVSFASMTCKIQIFS